MVFFSYFLCSFWPTGLGVALASAEYRLHRLFCLAFIKLETFTVQRLLFLPIETPQREPVAHKSSKTKAKPESGLKETEKLLGEADGVDLGFFSHSPHASASGHQVVFLPTVATRKRWRKGPTKVYALFAYTLTLIFLSSSPEHKELFGNRDARDVLVLDS